MGMWTHYGQPIDQAAIDAYVSANPLDEANALSEIGWQYWASTFLNEYEAFSNWRRTDTPELTPVNYVANVTNGTIPLRLAGSPGEAALNQESWDSAAARQGLSTDFDSHFTVPVWVGINKINLIFKLGWQQM